MMTKKGPFFYYPTFGPLPSLARCLSPFLASRTLRVGALSLWVNIPGLYSGPSLAPGSSVEMGPLFIPYVLGAVWPESVFLGGLGVVGPFPVLHPFVLHPSPVKSLANKKRDLFRGPFLSRCCSLALRGRSFGSFFYVLGFLVGFGCVPYCPFPVFVPGAGQIKGHY